VVRETAALTDRRFGGNLIHSSDQHRRLDEALEAGIRIVSLMWGALPAMSSRSTMPTGRTAHTVGSAEEARRAVASGVNLIVAQGWEAGGHVWSRVATLPLVPAVVDAVAPSPRRPRRLGYPVTSSYRQAPPDDTAAVRTGS
jgi:nitronate monooxygenase